MYRLFVSHDVFAAFFDGCGQTLGIEVAIQRALSTQGIDRAPLMVQLNQLLDQIGASARHHDCYASNLPRDCGQELLFIEHDDLDPETSFRGI